MDSQYQVITMKWFVINTITTFKVQCTGPLVIQFGEIWVILISATLLHVQGSFLLVGRVRPHSAAKNLVTNTEVKAQRDWHAPRRAVSRGAKRGGASGRLGDYL